MKAKAAQPGECHAHVPRGLLLQWHITERCNLRCAHCYQDEARETHEPPLDDLLRILEQFHELVRTWRATAPRTFRWAHLTITGGEPFARADVWRLLEAIAAHRRSFGFAILTNGTFIDAAAAAHLRALRPSFVQVSVEGARQTHDEIRGSGDFDRVVRAIRCLVGARIRTLISFTASRLNFREFPEVAELGRKLGVSRVWADRLLPVGHGAALEGQVLDSAETREFFQIMRKSRVATRSLWRPTTEIAMHRALQFLCGGRPYRCTAGDELLAVAPNGDVHPCRRLPIRAGNVFEAPLREIYEQSEVLRSLRNPDQIARGCERCAYARVCGGGLRCLSHAVRGDAFSADPGCWLAAPLDGESMPGEAEFHWRRPSWSSSEGRRQ